MMKKKNVIMILLAFFLLTTLGCNMAGTEPSGESVSRAVQNWEFWEPMDYYNSGSWNKADWTNGGMFNCGWLPDHVTFDSGQMTIRLDNYPSHGKPYSSGEYRTNNTFSYGTFETNMIAAKGSGLVTSFFLYTGNPWDEIDMEILGKNTYQAQLNYFVNGVGHHEKIIDLGFDASQGYHKYTIEWGEGYIKWYVDGSLRHSAYGGPQPTHPMQIMVNLWPGTGVDDWLGYYSHNGTKYAHYDYILYQPAGQATPDPPPNPNPNPVPSGQTVSLRSRANYQYVRAENAGSQPLIANSGSIGTWEQFKLIDNGDGTITLQSMANNQYVCAENAGGQALIANRGAIGSWEKFRVINNSDGTISLQSLANNQYVCAENAGNQALIANRGAIGSWEKFDLIYQ
jgi:beta-glucanase (GH16 family)